MFIKMTDYDTGEFSRKCIEVNYAVHSDSDFPNPNSLLNTRLIKDAAFGDIMIREYSDAMFIICQNDDVSEERMIAEGIAYHMSTTVDVDPLIYSLVTMLEL